MQTKRKLMSAKSVAQTTPAVVQPGEPAMPKAKEMTPAASMPAPEVPDWVDYTPDETTYDLVMSDDSGGSVQMIALTRDEFLELKAHLAKMRGLVPAQQSDAA